MPAQPEIPLGPVMVSISGTSLDATACQRLMSPLIGGVVLFAENCDSVLQVKELAEELHALRSPQLLIAIDQEGGRVQRIRDEVVNLPPQARYGELFDENVDAGCDAAELGGYIMARQMLDVGIDLSFSPVLDVLTAESKIIGDRSFHSNPESASVIAEAWMRGMARAGMKAVGKHFPGHGGVGADSHVDLPEDPREIQEVTACDLVPYRRLVNRLSGVMTAHVLYPNITSAIPTYSPFWLEHVLREVLAFYGAVFSDDLTMAGAGEAGDMDARMLTALSSGCDIVLSCQDEKVTDVAIEMLEKNPDSWRGPEWHYRQLQPEEDDDDMELDQRIEQFFKMLS